MKGTLLKATTRQLRVLALQALYALDASDGRDPEAVRLALATSDSGIEGDEGPRRGSTPVEPAEFTAGERRRAFETAQLAWNARAEADEFFALLAPTWPANRQPIIDRSILRLAWQEIRAGKTPPRVVVNESIDIAREFSTEKSPAFVNALLDKAMQRFESGGWSADDTDDTDDAPQAVDDARQPSDAHLPGHIGSAALPGGAEPDPTGASQTPAREP